MAESNGKEHGISDSNQTDETKERGCFDFLAKKEGKTEHDVVMEENRKEDLTRLHSQSSSSSDDEFEGEQKKNKLILEDNKNGEDVNDIEVVDVDDDKKGSCLDNIKAHIPRQHEKTGEGVPIAEVKHETNGKQLQENEAKEKKGILEKIKQKLHRKNEGELEEKKEN